MVAVLELFLRRQRMKAIFIGWMGLFLEAFIEPKADEDSTSVLEELEFRSL